MGQQCTLYAIDSERLLSQSDAITAILEGHNAKQLHAPLNDGLALELKNFVGVLDILEQALWTKDPKEFYRRGYEEFGIHTVCETPNRESSTLFMDGLLKKTELPPSIDGIYYLYPAAKLKDFLKYLSTQATLRRYCTKEIPSVEHYLVFNSR